MALYPLTRPQFFTDAGVVAASYKLFFYENGTTTKQNTTDGDGGATNPNPIILDSAGRPDNAGTPIDIFLTAGATYTVVLAIDTAADPPSAGEKVWTVDDVVDLEGFATEWVKPYAATRASTTTFTIAGADVTSIFHAGRRVKCTGGADRYGTITASSFSTDTTVTVGAITDNAGATATLHASMTQAEVGIESRNATSGGYDTFYPLGSGETAATIQQYEYTEDIRRFLPPGYATDGSVDYSTEVLAAFNSGAKRIRTHYGEDIQIASRQTITSIDGLEIFGGGTFSTADNTGIFYFNGCNDLTIKDIILTGAETRTTWQALTGGERQVHQSMIEVASADNVKISGVKTSGARASIKFTSCTQSSITDCQHTGCFGVISLGIVTDQNYGYAYFINGGSDIQLRNLKAQECSGTVLIGLSAPRIKSYGGRAYNHHDNGWYGSSCEDSVVHGFDGEEGLGNCVKMRGSNNRIESCHAKAYDSTFAYIMTGVPLDSAVDSQGAVGSGGGIYNCEAEDCDSLLSIRFTQESATLLYMRDVEAIGNVGNDLTGATNKAIDCYGIKNIIVKNNIVNNFASAYAYNIQGKDATTKGEGFDVSGNTADTGAAAMVITNIRESIFSQNKGFALTDVITFNTVTCDKVTFTYNGGDDPADRIDLRGSTSCKAFFNDMFIQADAPALDVEGNATNGTVDIATYTPTRVGQIVQHTTGDFYIAEATSAPSDWNIIS